GAVRDLRNSLVPTGPLQVVIVAGSHWRRSANTLWLVAPSSGIPVTRTQKSKEQRTLRVPLRSVMGAAEKLPELGTELRDAIGPKCSREQLQALLALLEKICAGEVQVLPRQTAGSHR